MSNFPAVTFEKTILSLMNCLGTLIKNELTINVCVYFWTINSVLLVYIVMPLPYWTSSKLKAFVMQKTPPRK